MECNKLSSNEELQDSVELIEGNHREAKKKYLENLRVEVMEFHRTGSFV
jgi:hypothetical protein